MMKSRLIWSAIWLALVSMSVAKATVVVTISANRGTVSADGTSLGAFTADTTQYNFEGLIWSGDASTIWNFNDAIVPGVLSSPTTIFFPPLTEAPMIGTLPYGGEYYVENAVATGGGGSPGATSVAPLFFTGMVTSGSMVITPSSGTAGPQTRFNAAEAGDVQGGGTFTLIVSGVLNGPDDAIPYGMTISGYALRLNGVDPSVYGGTNVVISGRASGVAVIPEPQTWEFFTVGLGFLFTVCVAQRKSLFPKKKASSPFQVGREEGSA